MGLEPLQGDEEHEVTVSTPDGDVVETVDEDTTIDSGISNQGSISDLGPGDSAGSGYYSSGIIDTGDIELVDEANSEYVFDDSESLTVELENDGLVMASAVVEFGGSFSGLDQSVHEIQAEAANGLTLITGIGYKNAGSHTIEVISEPRSDDGVRSFSLKAFEIQ